MTFRFSSDLLRSSHRSAVTELCKENDRNRVLPPFHRTTRDVPSSSRQCLIVSFSHRIALRIDDRMSDQDVIYLPYGIKGDAYKRSQVSYSTLYHADAPCLFYYLHVWKPLAVPSKSVRKDAFQDVPSAKSLILP